MGDDELGLSDEDVEKLEKILEKNREVGANEYTMGPDKDDED